MSVITQTSKCKCLSLIHNTLNIDHLRQNILVCCADSDAGSGYILVRRTLSGVDGSACSDNYHNSGIASGEGTYHVNLSAYVTLRV